MMKKNVKIVFLFCVCTFSVFGQSDSTAIQLAQKEREFSQSAATRGFIGAFLDYFDDSCIAFYPQPENAKHALTGGPESQASLVWRPTFVEVSTSGDFGFTTGPSEYRAGGVKDSTVYYGHFVSVWQKNGDGKWKVVLDVGSGYPKSEKKEEMFLAKELSSHEMKKSVSVDMERAVLMTADSAFSDLNQVRGSETALQKFASDDVRVYRKGSFPAQGKNNGVELVKNEKRLRYNLYAGKISSAADLGFTYGIAVDAASDTSSYVRIWQKENGWKVVVDVMKPWPTKK
jgi:ketosteroid isomerase-like protein